MKIALYRGRDRLFDRLIQWWTRSDYSHCEVVFAENGDSGQSYCASSSYLDGGIRFKWMVLKPEKWDIVEIDGDEVAAFAWFAQRLGRPYDVRGIIGCALRFIPASVDKWFCSSAIADAVGWPEAWRVVPAHLKNAADYRSVRHG